MKSTIAAFAVATLILSFIWMKRPTCEAGAYQVLDRSYAWHCARRQ